MRGCDGFLSRLVPLLRRGLVSTVLGKIVSLNIAAVLQRLLLLILGMAIIVQRDLIVFTLPPNNTTTHRSTA